MDKKILSADEVKQVKVFWDHIEQETGIAYPIPEKDYHKIPSAIGYMKMLCGNKPFDPIYAAQQYLIRRKSNKVNTRMPA